MKFGIHILPTYMSSDGTLGDYYRCMFEQIAEVEKLGFHQAWVTEHHFSGYGGTLPHPPTFIAAAAQRASRIRLGVAVAVLPLHDPLKLAESYAMADVISDGRLDFRHRQRQRTGRISQVRRAPGRSGSALQRKRGDHSPGVVG
jgi:hypothetical protein